MKTLRLVWLLLLQCFTITSSAQLAGGEFVIEINPANGTFTKTNTAPIPGINWVFPGMRTYDLAAGQYIFQGGMIVPDHLYSIDVTTGSVVTSPVFPTIAPLSSVREVQYDNSTWTLFGLHWDQALQQFYLATVNRTTGQHTDVGTTPITGLSGTTQGNTTFDEINHRFIHLANKQLVVIDAVTGVVATNLMLNLNPGEDIITLVYDNVTDQLWGVKRQTTTLATYFLCTINTTTGNVTTIGPGTPNGGGNGSGTIDVNLGRYFYNYSVGANYYLAAFNMTTGAPLFNHLIPLNYYLDNVYGIFYDNIRGKLFAIHWEWEMPLAVNLQSFTAKKDGHDIQLQWTLANETNTGSYVLERSAEGNDFVEVVNIPAKGESKYSFNDADAVAHASGSKLYYRLRIVEQNGKAAYSKIVMVNLDADDDAFSVYPNPFTTSITISATAVKPGTCVISIKDLNGRTVAIQRSRVQAGTNIIDVPGLEKLACGIYQVVADINGNIETVTVVKE